MGLRKTVFVGVSGGVDSSVALALLKDKGYDVVACFIKTWQPDFIECTWKEERRDAMRIAAALDVPFLTIDAEKEYRDAVAMYMIDEYKAGRTPNPDVMCNKEIKFGVFLKKAIALGADYVATGHYARIQDGKLLSGKDAAKDQSYFLWTLGKKELSRIMFPIGHLPKSKVRKIATKIGLLTAEKKDSQGVCFLGPIDMKDFLKHYIKTEEGDVCNTEGHVIGRHDGALFYTLGERHGFTITKKGSLDKRMYVVDRDLHKNILFVSSDPFGAPDSTERKRLSLRNTNWIIRPVAGRPYGTRVRYQQSLQTCRLEGDTVVFDEPQPAAAAGQSVVVYDGDECLGGGIIAS